MNPVISKLFLAAALVVAASGCLNASTLQTARVLPPGDQQAFVGGGMTTLPGASDDLVKAIASLPYGEVGYRLGVIDGIDVGAHATLIGTGGVDGKWQFLDEGPLAVATGLSVGYMQMTATSSGTGGQTSATGEEKTEPKWTLLDVVVPLYVSYDIGSHLAVYAAPKYLLRAVIADSGGNTQHNAGSTIGIKLGDGSGLMLESTFMRNLTESYNMLQFNAAIFWSR